MFWFGHIDGRRALVAIAALVLTLWGLPGSAHHSHGNYLTTEYTHLQGTVREIHWINPHTWIYLEVPGENDETTLWVLEGASPAELLRDGWARDDVEAGDTISVRCHQLRDRSNGCLLGFLTPEGGVEKEWD